MELSRSLRIFLLYARRDENRVCRLYNRLIKAGARVWLDRKDLLPGQDWQHEIRQAIRASDIVIVCLSKSFKQKGGYRHEELRIALEKASSLPEGLNLIIPARLEKCDLPESLCRWQRVDLFKANGYRTLLDALQEYATPISFESKRSSVK